MVKKKNFIISLLVYPFDVMVSIGETDDELFKILRKTNVKESELDGAKFDASIGHGRYCLFDCGASLIRLRHTPKTDFDFSILQHEILHATFSVLWRIGMELEIKKSDEAYCYLVQFLTFEIYKRI